MAKFKIRGKKQLSGEFIVSGAKNAALKMLPACVMIPGKTTIHNVPKIVDISKMIEIIKSLGAKVEYLDHSVIIDSTGVNSFTPDENYVKKLRGSVVIMGPLLSLFGKVTFSEPGGCLIGVRPIDTHLAAFRSLDIKVKIDKDNGKYYLSASGSYRRGDKTVVLEEMSVTATENVIMASVLRPGKTRIEIAACEPEIVDLANFLNKAGAKISGAGTNTITISGVKSLKPVEYTIMPDRIEAGTIAIAAAVTGGQVTIKNIIPSHLSLVLNKFKATHLDYQLKMHNKFYGDLIINQKRQLVATNTDTRPYPGFPTDLQSQYTVLMTQAKGRSRIFETLFSARFDYVKWLVEMGAKIDIESPHLIDITGPINLKGDEIDASDIRGGAALVIAALAAKGETIVDNIEYIDRGYENIDLRLKKLGAEIERIS
ncbi:UDP-N-acetylglucosamine 1-carboxyvinyltransferase [Candidatus Berkelbacteria bacterium CG_4_9_14_0_2_um_filter_42_30]|uniref:UDP-N-acetylglucosamine 1-carboxyvinyltransferase n=6 Tax=Candidatus Berkelbacteria TaxID=1618330 RepID=A0A2M7K199_9BACT|nr:MAG: UDP-N-acetylglucosamine 1-carboxyvinyltransferase [Candidatus Berkelbacteria bacterium CG1_02_42_45]PIP50840.1 MAG: UDP-N-acetylglucosamine 1-carboxyvinyltransferase [Candidatus Berkelbacteria bacterium CG23_combo_of_CG06-09_8_20_14_all_41_73]PIR27499.1 MAG: UDP-N-acetylglucosamine 1-carboxyvinyltransferase [Candidatus Berkelbacteria bacterium CG11_big_fil_rev_8_21_14_0_20_42_15]PIX30043.1 MAG: UDP-N-acetylglucosamine 1-carboxyvinyltransferase [Candidatus Berkelbacteria bacterium CG_4_8_